MTGKNHRVMLEASSSFDKMELTDTLGMRTVLNCSLFAVFVHVCNMHRMSSSASI